MRRNKILAVPILLVISLIWLLWPNTSAKAGWFNDNWLYRTALTIGNTGSADANKKVKFDIDTATLISAGKMQSDCGDSRFTDINGKPLKYYIDTAGGACNGASTDYYVLVSTINSGGTTLYHYYGNLNSPNGTESNQFTESTFSPTSGPAAASEEQSPGPAAAWSFDEGTGTVTYDNTSNGNNGTLTSGPLWKNESECISGKCLFFDGTNDYVDTFDPDNINRNAVTYSAWVKLPAYPSVAGIILSRDDGTDRLMQLQVETDGQLQFLLTTTSGIWDINIQNAGSTNAVSTNKWHFVTGTWDGTTGKIYLDGKLLATDTSSGNTLLTGSNNIWVGRALNVYTKTFIDEVRVYPYARSAAQIKADYAARGGIKGAGAQMGNDPKRTGESLTNGLVAYYPMDESSWTNNCSTTSITDLSGNGNNGSSCPNSTGPTGAGTGKFGNGGAFDGTDDYVEKTNFTGVSGSNPHTVSAWVKFDTISTGYNGHPILTWGSYSNNAMRSLSLSTGGGIMRSYYANDMNSGFVPSVARWYNIVWTFGGNGERDNLYIDGIMVDSDVVSGINTTASSTLSLGLYSSTRLDGSLDDVRIYNRALSPAEVQALYNWAPGPLVHYKLDERSGTTGYDSSTNSISASISGASWAPGKFGSGLSFDGLNDTATATISDTATSFTLGTWIYIRAFPGASNYDTFIYKGAIGQENYWFEINNTDELNCGFSTDHATTTANLSTNTWYHVACSFDDLANTLKIYVNGIQQYSATENSSPNTSNSSVSIGSPTWAGQYTNATLDDIRIYNYALTNKQVMNMMNGRDVNDPAVGSPVGHPIAHYSFEEGYGTTTQDKSINNNDGTLTSMASPATSTSGWNNSGKFGKALAFDGTNDGVSFTRSTAIANLSNEGSISAWVYYTVLDSALRVGVDIAGTGSNGLVFFTNGAANTPRLQYGTGSGTTTLAATNSFSTGTWYHVTTTWTSGGGKIYINGKFDGQNTTAPNISVGSGTSYIGCGSSCSIRFHAGYLDEIKIYNYALTEDEVKLEYNRGSSVVFGSSSTASDGTSHNNSSAREYCVPGDTSTCNAPIGEWKFDEGSGLTAYDTSGNENSGTLNGTMSNADWMAGKVGKSLYFDGGTGSGDTHVRLPDNAYDSHTNGAISFWFNPDGTGDTIQEIFSASEDDNNAYSDYAVVEYNVTEKRIETYIQNNGASIEHQAYSPSNSVTPRQWNYVSWVMDSTGNTLYINGIKQNLTYIDGNASTTLWFSDISENLTAYTIGCATSDGSDTTNCDETLMYQGKIDNFRIYNYARTPAQIAWEYNKGAPVAWYKFDECQGTTINDWGPNANGSFNANNGTLTIGSVGTNTSAGTCTGSAGEAWTDGRIGKISSSIDLDGSDDYVVIADNDRLDFGSATDFSFAAWIYLNNTTTYHTILDKRNSTTGFLFGVANADDKLHLFLDDGPNSVEPTGNTVLTANNWYHVIVSVDRDNNASFYLNGKYDGGGTVSTVGDITNAARLAIGYKSPDMGASVWTFLNGLVDDVRIFNYSLTPAQVKEVFNNGAVSFK